jgi:hypothetical protein
MISRNLTRLLEFLNRKKAVDNYGENITVKSQCEKDLDSVRVDGLNLEHIHGQTPEIVLAAVSQNVSALMYVKDQTPSIVLAAMFISEDALHYVKKQTPEIALAAVSQYGSALRYVKEQTAEIALAAVTQNGSALQFVKEQTPEIALAAVKQNGFGLKYVKDQNPKIALAAVSRDGNALKYVKEQTPEIALAAVFQDSWAFFLVKDQTSEIALAAVSQSSNILQHVNEQTEEIALTAVSKNGYMIGYVKEITKIIISVARAQVGDDLLNYSAKNNLVDAINFLIVQNVPVEHVSEKYPLTAFQLAAKHSKKDALLILSNNGANIHVKTEDRQRNVLSEYVADFCDYDEMGEALSTDIGEAITTISTLLEIGVCPKEHDKDGNTAITLAKDKPEILAILNAFELKKLINSTISKSQQPATRDRKMF